MLPSRSLTALPMLGISWLAAAAAYPLALLLAVLGQGLGSLVGGCDWIGISLPIGRQIWALVNQPVLNFSSTEVATGYWLGSLLLPLLIAVCIVPFLPRALSLAAELMVVQAAFAAAAAAVAWLPLLDLDDGHIARWLALHGLPPFLVWFAPAAAAGAALLPTLRLLELARRQHEHAARGHRLLVVITHLGMPLIVWVAAAGIISQSLLLAPTLGAATVLISGLLLAWFRYPPPYVRPLNEIRATEAVALTAVALLLGAFLWFAGKPLPGGKTAALLWAQPQAYNNLRPWIEPVDYLRRQH